MSLVQDFSDRKFRVNNTLKFLDIYYGIINCNYKGAVKRCDFSINFLSIKPIQYMYYHCTGKVIVTSDSHQRVD